MLLGYTQGDPMDLFLKISVLKANVCWLAMEDVEEMICPWKESAAKKKNNSWCPRGFDIQNSYYVLWITNPPFPPPPRQLRRGEYCPMTTPKLASNVWTYVCKPGCRCTLQAGNSSISLTARNRQIFPSNLSKCLKWLQKALFMLFCCFKISCWVPLYTVQWLPILHPRQVSEGRRYSAFQVTGMIEGSFGVWNFWFRDQRFLGRKFWQVIFWVAWFK